MYVARFQSYDYSLSEIKIRWIDTVALSAIVLLPMVRAISNIVAKRSCTGFLSRTLRQVYVGMSVYH